MDGDLGEKEMVSTYEIGNQYAGGDINQPGRDINLPGGDLYQAGRDILRSEGDIFITYERLQNETEFFEPNLDPFRYPNYISPTITPILIKNIRQNKLIVLGGDADIDKSSLARHIAVCLSDEIKVPVLEWNRSSLDIKSVENKLLETKEITIFILPKISPQDIMYDLSYIEKISNINQHFVLISTESTFLNWRLSDIDQHFWQDISNYYYDVDKLSEYLKKTMPKELLSTISEPEICEAAKELKTPENISIFIKLLRLEKKAPDQLIIKDLIDGVKNKESAIKRWYLALSSREQLLALGLSIFDGLFDDQFFAAFDRVVERVWQRRDSSLRALDYCDLDNLLDFISFEPTENYITKIECNFQKRSMLLRLAWKSHRRQILTALPVIAQLAIDSVASRSHNLELYGTLVRRKRLRLVIGEALGDLGLISFNSIRPILLQLAADKEPGVQLVAARAMARWCQHNRDEFFNMLEKLLEYEENEYIRATVALTVGYAARNSPNDLDNRLCGLLKRLAKDKSSKVRNSFCNYALRTIVLFHLRDIQIENFLQEIVQYNDDFIPEIAKSLALAYRYDSKCVNKMLNSFHQEYISHRSEYVDSAEITEQEKLLATEALTYGYIEYDTVTGEIPLNEAFRRTQSILKERTHLFVHDRALIALTHLALNNFEEVEPIMRDQMDMMNESDKDEIVKTLKKIFLKQRAEQEIKLNGEKITKDLSIKVDGKEIPIWVNLRRPQTSVEKAMLRWINSTNLAAQQIAIRSQIEFEKALNIKERQLILEFKERQNLPIIEKKSQIAVSPTPIQLIKENEFMQRAALWFATWNAKKHRNILQGLLPEVLVQGISNKQEMTFVIENWHQAEDSEIRIIAELLEKTISYIENRKLMIGASILGIIILLFIIGSMSNGLLLLILIILFCVLFVWFRIRYASEKQKDIKVISLRQVARQLRDRLEEWCLKYIPYR